MCVGMSVCVRDGGFPIDSIFSLLCCVLLIGKSRFLCCMFLFAIDSRISQSLVFYVVMFYLRLIAESRCFCCLRSIGDFRPCVSSVMCY